jgi:hypothetical protein
MFQLGSCPIWFAKPNKALQSRKFNRLCRFQTLFYLIRGRPTDRPNIRVPNVTTIVRAGKAKPLGRSRDYWPVVSKSDIFVRDLLPVVRHIRNLVAWDSPDICAQGTLRCSNNRDAFRVYDLASTIDRYEFDFRGDCCRSHHGIVDSV